jgi:O-antigen/teichoic acid export membrane protein
MKHKFLVSLLPQLVNAIIALATIRIYSGILSSVQLGEIMLALGFMALMDALFSSSINQSIFYFACKPNGLWNVLQIIIKSQSQWFWLPLIVLSVAGSSFVLYTGSLPVILYWTILAMIAVAYIVVESIRSCYTALLNASQFKVAFGIQIVIDAILVLLVTSATLTYKPEVYSLFIGILIARLVSVVFVSSMVRHRYSHIIEETNKSVPTQKLLRRDVLIHARPFIAMGAVGWASSFADRYAVAWTGGVAAAGIYAVATGLMGRPYNILSASFTTHFRPTLFANVASGNANAIRESHKRWLTYALGLGLLGTGLGWVLDQQIVNLLLAVEHRSQVMPLIPILGLAFTATIVTHAFDNQILARGQGNRLLSLQMVCVPITVLALAGGSLLGGAIGAAWGRLVSELIRLVAVLVFSTVNNHGRDSKI